MLTDADTCRKYVVPKLQGAGWDNEPHFDTERRSAKFVLSEFTVLPPISHRGNLNEIVTKFGGADRLRTAVNQLQSPPS
jgi:hypothetical protein